MRINLNEWGYKRSFLNILLYPVGFLYILLMKLRFFLYNVGIFKRYRLPAKVISIGNITLGGTGKTPLVIEVALYIKSLGFKVGVISRGYKGKYKNVFLVSDGSTVFGSVDLCGDEPIIIARATGCPVVVARDRVKGFNELKKLGVDVVILDDGFQHLKILKDLDIVLIDGTRGFGNGFGFPAGVLREAVDSIKRADIIAFTKGITYKLSDMPDRLISRKPTFYIRYDIKLIKGSVGEGGIVVTCIPNFEFFISLLKLRGIKINDVRLFMDHHRYSIYDVEDVLIKGEAILTTLKDYENMPESIRSYDKMAVFDLKVFASEEFFDTVRSAIAS